MFYSAPPTKPWNFALLIVKPYSSTKAGSSDQIGSRDGQFVPFFGKQKVQRNVQGGDIEPNF